MRGPPRIEIGPPPPIHPNSASPQCAPGAPGPCALASCALRSGPAPQRPHRRGLQGAGQADKGGRQRRAPLATATERAPGEAAPSFPVRKSCLGAARGARGTGGTWAAVAQLVQRPTKGEWQGVPGEPQQ